MKNTRTTSLAVNFLGVAVLAVLGACGGTTASATRASGADAPAAASEPGAPATTASGAGSLAGTAVQLEADPCTLLTIPEIEAVLGSGVEQGGFGDDLPGRCTYSLGGDVGAGVVQITLRDPLECNVVMKAMESDSLGATAERIDVGDGGIYVEEADATFTIHGGCAGVGGSAGGVNLGHDVLIALATKIAARLA
ncbi:MAG: hypothetical protein ABI894_09720 [Ilumatobacteraceae bacterium]